MYKALTKELFSFIEQSPTSFHAVETTATMLLAEGFVELCEGDPWHTVANGRYFTRRNGSSLIAFCLPSCPPTGFQIVASHSDSPAFKLKENAGLTVEKQYTRLNTECYGGMIQASWMDRPLSIAGRVMLKTTTGITTKLVDFNRDLLIIPNVAIHLQRNVNEGYKFNPQVDLLPLLGGGLADFPALLAKEAGAQKEDVLSSDLFLYPRVKGVVLGAEGEFIASPRLDDLQCAFCSVKALLESANGKNVRVCAIFDNEEVGSGTKQGAGSTFLFDTLTRLCQNLGKTTEEYHQAVWNSFMLSADNAHAVHPNFPEKSDQNNRNYLNGGVVIKFNANQKYTTDAVSASVFRGICARAKVPVQVFHNRSDLPGGSTLGNISSARVSLNTVDIGIPQLAMHSAVETAGIQDTLHMKNAMQAFYGTEISRSGEDTYKF